MSLAEDHGEVFIHPQVTLLFFLFTRGLGQPPKSEFGLDEGRCGVVWTSNTQLTDCVGTRRYFDETMQSQHSTVTEHGSWCVMTCMNHPGSHRHLSSVSRSVKWGLLIST